MKRLRMTNLVPAVVYLGFLWAFLFWSHYTRVDGFCTALWFGVALTTLSRALGYRKFTETIASLLTFVTIVLWVLLVDSVALVELNLVVDRVSGVAHLIRWNHYDPMLIASTVVGGVFLSAVWIPQLLFWWRDAGFRFPGGKSVAAMTG